MNEKLNTEKGLTLGSHFDGSGGFLLAGLMADIHPVWSDDVEPFPIRVTEKRLPDVKQYGDINKLSGAQLEPVDIITFGFPCTDISIAGKQEGLHAARSGLFFQAIRTIREMREGTDGKYPRYAIAENVKGLLSSKKGKDFREVLEEFCRVKDPEAHVPMPEKGKWEHAGCIMGDGYSVAWRLFNTCGWGLPQRRERVYFIADFAGGSAGDILFKPESGGRNFKEGFDERKEAAAGACGRPDEPVGIEG